MYASLGAIAEGIGAQATASISTQLAVTFQAVFLIIAILPLQQAWSQAINEDVQRFAQYTAMAASPLSPEKAAAAAQANQQKILDSNQANLETGKLNTLLEQVKTQVHANDQVIDQIGPSQRVILDYMNLLINLLLKKF